MASQFLPEPQRRLFYGIWALVAIGVGIWALPGPDRWSAGGKRAPKVILGPELQGMFLEGVVAEHAPESFLLQMKLSDAYLRTIPETGREFSLGYQYRKAGIVLKHGHLAVRVPAEERVRFRLPNPGRGDASEIVLSLLP